MEQIVKKHSILKKLGWTGITLCGLCCALPIVGAIAGVGALTALSFYLEKIAIIALGLAGLFFVYYFYKKKKAAQSCDKSCQVDCNCKNAEA